MAPLLKKSRHGQRNILLHTLQASLARCMKSSVGRLAASVSIALFVVRLVFPTSFQVASTGNTEHEGVHLLDRRIVLNADQHGKSEIKQFYIPSTIVEPGVLAGVTIKTRDASACRAKNALVLLAQKKHSTYGRDSLELLVKTLELFRDNYLSLGSHQDNVDVFLFHTGDFQESDLVYLEGQLLQHSHSKSGILRMVNLNNTAYWSLPKLVKHDNQELWKGSEIYPVGYRHMCRWFGMQLWNFFQDLNQQIGCNYRYIARLDEDSFILSPIHYDIFDLMQSQRYVYGYRMCAYELEETLPKIWFKKWRKKLQQTDQHIYRTPAFGLCGFYTNFFVADLQFFLSAKVSNFLREIDDRGFFYRKRFGDLLVHSLAVYAFAPPAQIHRFLDFTYQHATIDYFKDREKECISWGSIQAGYNDANGEQIVDEFYRTHVIDKDCPTANITYLSEEDLSPTYSHVPEQIRQKRGGKIKLKTVHAGKVEVPNQGILSG